MELKQTIKTLLQKYPYREILNEIHEQASEQGFGSVFDLIPGICIICNGEFHVLDEFQQDDYKIYSI